MGRQFYTLRKSDVGHALIVAFGRSWSVSSFLGRVMARDVGKHVFKSGDVLQVENDDQRAERLSKRGQFDCPTCGGGINTRHGNGERTCHACGSPYRVEGH